ncbi:hypothetical protein EDB19DRAFT_396492 [Suillus lakei]|nr:hypothetical protein EDB19DRAFT_396492 [Suillus lakei]
MLGVIVIARLHAMYQGSRRILTFLIVIFLAVNIAYVVITAIGSKHIVGEELILSGTYVHASNYEGDVVPLSTTIWVLNTVWEVLALCFLVWTAVKHFRNLRQLGPSTGSTIGDCFTVLIKSHMLYFARTHTPWAPGYIMVLFKFPRSCRCLCWDHASSLAFENITLSA